MADKIDTNEDTNINMEDTKSSKASPEEETGKAEDLGAATAEDTAETSEESPEKDMADNKEVPDIEAKEAKDDEAKEDKEAKDDEAKEAKDDKEAKEAKDDEAKEAKDDKEAKKEEKNKETKEDKQSKASKKQSKDDAAATETKADKPTAKKEAKKASKATAKEEQKPAKPIVLAPSISGIEPEKKPVPLKTSPETSSNDKNTRDGTGYRSREKSRAERQDLSSILSIREAAAAPKELQPPAKGVVFYATGRRKTSSARVYLSGGKGNIRVNGHDINDYFSIERMRNLAIQPLLRLNSQEMFDLNIRVRGGGIDGQAGAIKHGIARALLKYDEDLKRFLRKAGYLTRDPRSVERKKVGLHKARKSPQFSKR